VIVAPIAFVSEHSETLVELDIEYRRLAGECGVPDYRRAATAGIQADFVAALAGLVRQALAGKDIISGSGGRLCPEGFKCCGFG
jgi:ferrochelatase